MKLLTNGVEWHLPAPPFRMKRADNPVHVALLVKAQDYHCCLLAGLGFNYECIQRQTGLSKSQISYRLKKAGLSVRAYREGKTTLANVVIVNAGRRAALVLNQALAEFNPT